MTASALTQAARRGLLARRSPVLKLEGDERLVALIRAGNDRAFEVMFDRYQSRLLAFCTSMLKSRQDAEDVLQEVFTNAHKAMLADERKINLRPWLYRIARNRCLNHLRKPVPEGQDSMDIHPHRQGATTAEHVENREELRQLLDDVRHLPETQRTALLLREIDQLTYEEIAVAMDTTIPSIKSLLVRARIGLAESSQARALTCDEVRVQLAETAEGIRKASGPIRKHVRRCEDCKEFRDQLRSDSKALAAMLPLGPLAMLKGGLLAKLFGGGTSAGGGATAGGGVAAASGGAAAAGGGAAAGAVGGAAAGGAGLAGGALGAKAAAGMATAAILTGAAGEVSDERPSPVPAPAIERSDDLKRAKINLHAKRERLLATIGAGAPVIAKVGEDPVTATAPGPEPEAVAPAIRAEPDAAEQAAPGVEKPTKSENPAEAEAPAAKDDLNPVVGEAKREVPTESGGQGSPDTDTPAVGAGGDVAPASPGEGTPAAPPTRGGPPGATNRGKDRGPSSSAGAGQPGSGGSEPAASPTAPAQS